jgi:hypothetical protein
LTEKSLKVADWSRYAITTTRCSRLLMRFLRASPAQGQAYSLRDTRNYTFLNVEEKVDKRQNVPVISTLSFVQHAIPSFIVVLSLRSSQTQPTT